MNDSDLHVCLARLDERLKALSDRIKHSDIERDKAIGIARDELARRLDILNHAHADAVRVQTTYVPREVHDVVHEKLVARVVEVENEQREWRGRLLPIVGVTAAVSGVLGAGIMRYVVQ